MPESTTTEITKVFTTKDYDQFKMLQGNRPIDMKHVTRLKEAISRNNMLDIRPIIVNKRMVIVDGQHRFTAAKELGIPISYMVRDDVNLSDVQTLNSNNKNWSADAYLNSYVVQGNQEYMVLKDFCKRWNVSIGEALHLLSGQHRNYEDFQEGRFKVRQWKQGEKVMEMVYGFEKFYKGFKRRGFVLAIAALAEIPEYDHEQMMKKMEFCSAQLVDCTTTSIYLKVLENIYNYKARNLVRFELKKQGRDTNGHFEKKEIK